MTNSITSTSTSTSNSTIDKIKSLKHAYSQKKAAEKEAKKVDFYLKNYGFVPKNVMTEAEWERARKNAPKVKGATNGLKATAYQGHYW